MRNTLLPPLLSATLSTLVVAVALSILVLAGCQSADGDPTTQSFAVDGLRLSTAAAAFNQTYQHTAPRLQQQMPNLAPDELQQLRRFDRQLQTIGDTFGALGNGSARDRLVAAEEVLQAVSQIRLAYNGARSIVIRHWDQLPQATQAQLRGMNRQATRIGRALDGLQLLTPGTDVTDQALQAIGLAVLALDTLELITGDINRGPPDGCPECHAPAVT